QQIIKPNCNVFMVINGHYPGEGRRTDLNDCGQPVHQILMDYQDRANGGDGWLRYFTFKPSENKIYAYTYSMTRNGGAGEFETDSTSQFVLDYDMQGTPFSVIATNTSISSGTRTRCWCLWRSPRTACLACRSRARTGWCCPSRTHRRRRCASWNRCMRRSCSPTA